MFHKLSNIAISCFLFLIWIYSAVTAQEPDQESQSNETLNANDTIVCKCLQTCPKCSVALLLEILIPVVIVGLLLIASAVFLVLHYRSKSLLSSQEMKEFFNGHQFIEENMHQRDDVDGIAECQPYNKNKYELQSSSYTIDSTKCLGSGIFGNVYSASIQRGEYLLTVAVKTVKTDGQAQTDGILNPLRRLMHEIKILSFVGKHPNIVNLEGVVTANLRRGELFVFLELCELGSLQNYLRLFQPQIQNNDEHISSETNDARRGTMYENVVNGSGQLASELSEDLCRWAGEVASGMEFIAAKNIVHGDVATRNILLNSNKCAKISDFGLSRRLYDYEYVKKCQEPLPWRWMSPESLKKLVFNEKTDVWSFGIALWEIFTLGDLPYPGMSWDVNFVGLLDEGLKIPEPKYNVNDIYSVILLCCNIHPGDRPTFADLKSLLCQD